ncbi:hypothetical protein AVEN_231064-1 [Araneus ventricosus]|uniref:Mutator-like transposase domain-containing protein n=1 Tax=Araneus ventricosus TaxID=182803 RepID=A0A4Y2A5H3_ARAVE|nr:hypothetical protein AVEN_231064-1 [Araneus ventricosus]
MPRHKQFVKRKCHRNQLTDMNQKEECADKKQLNASASKRKLNSSDLFPANNVDENDKRLCNEETTNIIVDLNVLKTLLNTVSKCKRCNSTDCFDVLEETNSRRGLATSLLFICKSCGCFSSSVTSYIFENGYDINTRLVYGMRCIGKVKCVARTSCAVMKLLPPPAKFEQLNYSLCQALSYAFSKSMLKAVEGDVSRNDNARDITIAMDGTWQKRGNTSINGVITATSLDTGYSGGMESEGAMRMFQRSVSTRNVRYENYLGDGDSKVFLKISESKVYGEELVVEKLQCIGHVQQRMGTRLRNLRNKLKSTKLSDGKKISGRGRLTDAQIINANTKILWIGYKKKHFKVSR